MLNNNKYKPAMLIVACWISLKVVPNCDMEAVPVTPKAVARIAMPSVSRDELKFNLPAIFLAISQVKNEHPVGQSAGMLPILEIPQPFYCNQIVGNIKEWIVVSLYSHRKKIHVKAPIKKRPCVIKMVVLQIKINILPKPDR